MAHFPKPGLRVFFAFAAFAMAIVFAVLSGAALAQSVVGGGNDWTGYAGVGVASFPRYTDGKGTELFLAPILMFEYKETYGVDLMRAGVLLTAMVQRRSGIEMGPNLEWDPLTNSVSPWRVAGSGDDLVQIRIHDLQRELPAFALDDEAGRQLHRVEVQLRRRDDLRTTFQDARHQGLVLKRRLVALQPGGVRCRIGQRCLPGCGQ